MHGPLLYGRDTQSLCLQVARVSGMQVLSPAYLCAYLSEPSALLVCGAVYAYEIDMRETDRSPLLVYRPVNVEHAERILPAIYGVRMIISVSVAVCIEEPLPRVVVRQ